MVKRKSRSLQPTKSLPSQLQQVNLNAAGIDVGSEFHFVAVPPDRDQQPVRKFSAFTTDLLALADWLKQCAVKTVVMESTGVYWIPLFELLESHGFEVMLVDPRRLKSVPGRKTDFLDCQWLQQLHTFGLLSGAFRPAEQVCVLRSYMRQRAMLIQYASHHIQHMQKALHQMNIKLDKVISDITGVTGTAIIKAILDGERDPVRLANLRNQRCQNSEETIAKALCGNWREEHLFSLRQATTLYATYKEQLKECDRQIQAHLATFDDKSGDQPLSSEKLSRKPNRNAPQFDAITHIYRVTGVDLTRIDGIDGHTALKVISEIGTDMNRWPSVKHFTSWLSLSPGNKQSGGKVLSGRTKPSANRAAAALRVAAQSLHSSKTALGAYFRRMRARLGSPKAITAAAHKLARLIYFSLKGHWDYLDPGQDWYEKQYQNRILQSLRRRASELGYTLVSINPQLSSS
jgi:transposase